MQTVTEWAAMYRKSEPMRLFMATIYTETNTFADLPTGESDFFGSQYSRSDASRYPDSEQGVVHAEWRRLAECDGLEVVEGPAAMAIPGGKTTSAAFDRLRRELMNDLKNAGKIDIVLLYLHGAMVSENCDDCEGEILAEVRKIVGSKPTIGVELDLHCHASAKMFENSDILMPYKEYPHIDELDIARRVYQLSRDTAKGRVNPQTAVFDCKMVGLWPTTAEPMRNFVDTMYTLEEENALVLSVSLAHSFPWGDVPEAGAKLWVTSDGNRALAKDLAKRLGQEFYRIRSEIGKDYMDATSAVEIAATQAGRTILADASDNPGAGAAGDNSVLLSACLHNTPGRTLIGCLWDPQAAKICLDAGEGTTLSLRLGGKTGKSSSDPVDLHAQIRAIRPDHYQTGLSGSTRVPFGLSVLVECSGIDIVLVSERNQIFSVDAFTNIGIDPLEYDTIIVKSAHHFFSAFQSLADRILYVSTPGSMNFDFGAIEYLNRKNDYWPRSADPLGGDR